MFLHLQIPHKYIEFAIKLNIKKDSKCVMLLSIERMRNNSQRRRDYQNQYPFAKKEDSQNNQYSCAVKTARLSKIIQIISDQ